MMIEPSPWICHICDHASITEEGSACAECFKMTCRQHLRTTSLLNPESGLYQLVRICSLCQLRMIS